MKNGIVKAVSKSATHSFNKYNQDEITLLEGLGVEGDAHMGKKIKHRSRVAKDPNQPNLRQVHLIHSELHEELRQKGFLVKPGEMGENITTEGIDVLNLPRDTVLKIGATKIQVKGLRNPCLQLDSIQKGLMKELVVKDDKGGVVFKAGIMGIVLTGGKIRTGDQIEIELPEEKPFKRLEKV